jgi:tetratricopeptide (TPR) repeat protein
MDRKILTTYCDLLCLRSGKIRGVFLLGGNARLKPLIIILLATIVLAVPVFAGPGDVAYKQAQDLINNGDLQGALAAANSGLTLEPANFKLLLITGDIYFAQANYDSALVYYQKAVEKKDKDPDALYGAGMAAFNIRDFDRALEFFTRGEKTGKNKPKFYYGLGLAQMEKGDYQNADINFRKAIDKDKKNPVYHLALAEVNYRNKVFPIALSEYSKAIELDSTLYSRKQDIHYKMAQSNFNMRNIPDAIKEYQIDVQLHPSDSTAWMELARIYEVSGNIPQAVFSYEKYLAIDSARGQAWYDLGKLYLKVPDPPKAAAAFEKAIRFDSHVAEAYGQLATIYAEDKQYDKAFNAYNRYEATFGPPDSALYWFEKGKVLMKIGEKNAPYFDSALVAFNRAVLVDSNFAAGYEYAGLTRYYQKNYKEAISYFIKEVKLDSTSINTYRNLAFSYLKTEQYGSAAQSLVKALELKPDDVVMRSMLARIYSFNKNYQSAVDQYEYILNHENADLNDSVRCEIYPELGSDYLQLGNCRTALPILLKADKCKPNDFSIIMNIASSYELCDKIDDANSYYKKALELNPKSKDAMKGEMRTRLQGKG